MTKTAAGEAGKNLPATQGGNGVPQIASEFADTLNSMAGYGMEGVTQQDVLLPRLGIIQALSPQLNPRKPEYIEGAKLGMIFDTATGKLYPDGLVVCPVIYQRRHIEWRRNRGGLVKDWGTDDSILSRCKDEPRQDRPGVILQITPDDNILTVTATWYVLNLTEHGAPAFIPMSSSQWKSSRKWMSLATSERVEHPTNGIFQPPLFYRTYTLKSALMTKGDDEWYVFTVERAETLPDYINTHPGSGSLIADAKTLFEQVRSGDVKAAVDEAFGAEAEAESSRGPADAANEKY